MKRAYVFVTADGRVWRGEHAADEALASGSPIAYEADYPNDGREEPAEVAELAAALAGDVEALGAAGKREELGTLAERVRGTPEEAEVLLAIRAELDKRLTEIGAKP